MTNMVERLGRERREGGISAPIIRHPLSGCDTLRLSSRMGMVNNSTDKDDVNKI